MQNRLQLTKDQNYHKYFAPHLVPPKSQEDYFSLETLRDGLERERHTLIVISRLRKFTKDQNTTPEKLFSNMDLNEKRELDITEFTNMIQIIDDKITKSEIQDLFERMDADSNGVLTSKEFCNGIFQGADDAQAIEQTCYKPFIEAIQM